jgi:hypothetical protein
MNLTKNKSCVLLWGSLLAAPFMNYAMDLSAIENRKKLVDAHPLQQSIPTTQSTITPVTTPAVSKSESDDDSAAIFSEQDFWHLVFAACVFYNAAAD